MPSSEVPSTTPAPTSPFLSTPRTSPRVPCPRGYIFSEESKRCVGKETSNKNIKRLYRASSNLDNIELDINECTSGNNPCRGNQQCENTVGSYVCRCAIGYRFNAVTQYCEGKFQVEL